MVGPLFLCVFTNEISRLLDVRERKHVAAIQKLKLNMWMFRGKCRAVLCVIQNLIIAPVKNTDGDLKVGIALDHEPKILA